MYICKYIHIYIYMYICIWEPIIMQISCTVFDSWLILQKETVMVTILLQMRMMMMITTSIGAWDGGIHVIIIVGHLMAALLWCLSSRGLLPWFCPLPRSYATTHRMLSWDMNIKSQDVIQTLTPNFWICEFSLNISLWHCAMRKWLDSDPPHS